MTEPKEHPFFNVGEIPCREISDLTALPKTPLVSVSMVTYNQEPFIAQAIEGVLMQETDFPIELLIGEDCSTDRTREIVLRYQNICPDLIRIITSAQNVGPQQNGLRTAKACRGKYIAYCEGDDYWTDPCKLQKQVALLQAHPEASMCAAMAECRGTIAGKPIEPYVIGGDVTKEFLHFSDLLDCYIHTSTYLLRSDYRNRAQTWFEKMSSRDLVTLVVFSDMGPIAFLPEVVSVHRVTSEGICSSLPPRAKALFVTDIYENLYCNYKEKYRHQFAEKLVRCFIGRLFSDIKHLNFSESYSILRKMSKLIWKHHLTATAFLYAAEYANQRVFKRKK